MLKLIQSGGKKAELQKSVSDYKVIIEFKSND